MNQTITAVYLERSFTAYNFDWELLLDQFQLDLAHVQLLRDFSLSWPQPDKSLLFSLLALVDAINRGSLCLLLTDEKWLENAASVGCPDINEHLHKLDLSGLQLHGESILELHDQRLYFQKHHHQQTALQQQLQQLINESQVIKYQHNKLKATVNAVVEGLPYQLENKQIQALLTAMLQPFSIISGGPGTGKTTILLSILRALFDLGLKADQIALVAPTGRAANRMTESIGTGMAANKNTTADDVEIGRIEATTIHRLLGHSPHHTLNRFHAENLLPQTVVVVDEVSMVDLMLMNQLLQALSTSTRIIFIGDQFQLPSVQSGAMLADLMPPLGVDSLNTAAFVSQLMSLWPTTAEQMAAEPVTEKAQLLTDKVTVLKVSKRCEPHIAALSELVRSGHAAQFLTALQQHAVLEELPWHNNFKATALQGVYWLRRGVNDSQLSLPLYTAWSAYHFGQATASSLSYVELLQNLKTQYPSGDASKANLLTQVFSVIKSQRILTLTNTGPAGADQINQLVANWLRKQLQVTGFVDCFHGALIMIQRNDANLGLFNGDVGVVIEVSPQQFQVVFLVDSQCQSYAYHLIPKHKLAFAITVHKSQGSEFNHVLMPLPDQIESPMLSREIIYTGMTRAKQSVSFYGNEAALETAIHNKTIRHSGLNFWYNPKQVK